ncbi:MAG: TonB-dependent receptor [Bacteroidales bacterium]|nr:TonB-dependent receptor [Bacteroidales bacterium]
MKCKNSLCLLALILILFPGTLLFAQTAIIRGKVVDKATGEELPGANIVIKGTTTGVSSDLIGLFELKNIQPGTYTFTCTYISYKPLEFPNIRLTAGQVYDLPIAMESEAFMMEGVTIIARRTTGTDMALLSAIKSSEIVVSGISSQQIKRSQDSDAAQVVKRVPGVTIVGDRFINIRGLSERYNAVMLHDVYAPSMEADVRSFSFDMIPSTLIDRIMIYKSPSPELPGDFAGGTVKIYTKGIPDENLTQISYSAGIQEKGSFRTFYRAPQDPWYWTGFNTGTYNLPDQFPEGLRAVANDEEILIEAGRSLPNSWVADELNQLWNQSVSFNLNRRINMKNNRYFGNITSITYNNKKSQYIINRKDFNSYDFDTETTSELFDFDDNRYVENIRFGILQNFAFSINPNNLIEFKNLYNQLSQSEYILRTGRNFDFGYNPYNHSFYQIYRGIYTGQLSGNHKFGNNNNIDWVAGYGLSFRDEPDYRRYRSDLDTITGEKTLYVPVGAAATYFLGRFYSHMQENNVTISLNYSKKLGKSESQRMPAINAGLFAEFKARVFSGRNLGYVRNVTGFDTGLLDVTIDSLFHLSNINPTYGIMIDEQTNSSDSYDASNLNAAGYLSVFIPLSSRFNVSGGIRLEHNNQSLNSFTLSDDPVNVDMTTLSILPSVNISYSLGEKMLVRAAYGKTVNRPEFRELAPFGFYDFNYNLVKKGSDTIRSSTIHNVDLRWEFYPSPTEVINFGIFYKYFIDPIETSFVPGGGSGGIKTFTFANAKAATSLGVEAEVRKSLKGYTGSGFVDRLSLLFNAAFIYSQVELGAAALGQSISSRPMYGQSPYIVNAGLYFNDPITTFNIVLLYNVIGKRIYIVGYEDYPDIYEMPRNLLDMTVTKNFGEHWEVKFGISNILAAPSYLIQDGNQDGIFDPKTDQVIQSYIDPRNYSIGITYSF